MKTAVFFYTGTGNSLWLARRLARASGGTDILSLNSGKTIEAAAGADAVGLAFPVHMWGVPRRIVNFVSTLPAGDKRYYFALAANAGQVSETLVQLERLLAARGIKLSAGFEFVLPSNYIPWSGAEAPEKQKVRFAAAEEKIQRAAAFISGRARGRWKKGPSGKRYCFPDCATPGATGGCPAWTRPSSPIHGATAAASAPGSARRGTWNLKGGGRAGRTGANSAWPAYNSARAKLYNSESERRILRATATRKFQPRTCSVDRCFPGGSLDAACRIILVKLR